ncbi:MAG: RNA-binding S4 domain-containing protein [Paracoccaceae bacterium]
MDGRIRLDKWLWQARFLKSRSLAAALIEAGHVRLNGAHVTKPAQTVGPGDVLTFALQREIRVVRVLACGTRRGPASEARTLYAEAGGTVGPSDPAPGE